jgi:hypothetical protein
MTQQESHVLHRIRVAFAGVTLGTGVGLREAQGIDDYADEQTRAAYRSQDEEDDWARISVDDLDSCYSSLSFFDADGMRFHLPAYLVADLNGSLRTASVLFHLCYLASAESHFATLTEAQREAVREFLLLRLSDPHWEFDHSMIETALREYWIA